MMDPEEESLARGVARFNAKKFQEDLTALGEAWDKHYRDTDAQNASNPDNGKQGAWNVIGIRHEAWVKSAASATEAAEKAVQSGIVGAWEAPVAHYVGPELPEVFG